MKTLIMLACAAHMMAFAADKGDNATAGASTAKTGDKPKAPAKPRVEPQLTSISTAVPLPEVTTRRGSTSAYPFADLAAPTRDENGNITAPASFGVKNKSARDMAQTVSNQNRKYRVEKRDQNGNVVYKTKTVKDAQGNEMAVPTQEAEMVAQRHFIVVDVDPKTDPDGATCRVFRDQ